MRKAYEFHIESILTLEALNALGAQGWHVAAIAPGGFVMQRELPPSADFGAFKIGGDTQ